MIIQVKFNYNRLYTEILLPGFTLFEPEKRIESRYHYQANGDFSNASSVIIPMQGSGCIWENNPQFVWNQPQPPHDFTCKWREIGDSGQCYCYQKMWLYGGIMTKAACAGVARTTPDAPDAPTAPCYRAVFPPCFTEICQRSGGGSCDCDPDEICCADGRCCPRNEGRGCCRCPPGEDCYCDYQCY